MAYRSSIHSVTKYSPAYVVLGFPLSLPVDCIYSTSQTAIYATSSDYVFTMKPQYMQHQMTMFSQWNKNYRKCSHNETETIGQYQQQWTKFLHLAMMAYRSSIHSVTKYSPAYVVLGFPLSLPVDCIYSTPQTAIYATPSDYVFTMKQKLQETQPQWNRNYRPISIWVDEISTLSVDGISMINS